MREPFERPRESSNAMPPPRIRLVAAFAVVLTGCADRELGGASGDGGGGDAAADAVVPPAPRFDVFDYGSCSLGAVIPDCDGLECAEDGTEELYELFVDIVEQHRLADYIDISRTYFQIGQRVDFADFQLHVGWIRSSHALAFPTENEDERRQIIVDALGAFEVPLTLADPDDIAAEVRECLMVELDPCHDFDSPALVSKQLPYNGYGSQNLLVHVDTKTASTVYCGPVDAGD